MDGRQDFSRKFCAPARRCRWMAPTAIPHRCLQGCRPDDGRLRCHSCWTDVPGRGLVRRRRHRWPAARVLARDGADSRPSCDVGGGLTDGGPHGAGDGVYRARLGGGRSTSAPMRRRRNPQPEAMMTPRAPVVTRSCSCPRSSCTTRARCGSGRERRDLRNCVFERKSIGRGDCTINASDSRSPGRDLYFQQELVQTLADGDQSLFE